MDRVTWLKTLWQYNFKSPAHLRRMSFIVHYQKFKEFWIWKYVTKFFWFFKHFLPICGLGASIADFGTRGPVFKSRLYLFFFLVKMLVSTGFEPRAFKSKVSYAYPYTTETEVLVQKKIPMSFCLMSGDENPLWHEIAWKISGIR